MKIWIKTQSENRIILCDDIRIEYNSTQSVIEFGRIQLGQYYSKERGFEILEEIQEKLSSFKENEVVIYEMPKK